MPLGADIALALTPVIAAAAGVERLLETVFNTIEGTWRAGVAYLGYGFRWLKSAQTEAVRSAAVDAEHGRVLQRHGGDQQPGNDADL